MQHIKEQYGALKPILDALVTAYPQHLKAAWFSWEAYLWAVQLWYAYAMKVKWPDNSSKECLVPFASLLNHSPYPHIVQYGQIDAETRQLRFPLFRPVSKGQQCFLSYGALSHLKLMLFYGMAIPDNPHDVVHIQLKARADAYKFQVEAMMEDRGLSLHHKINKGHALPVQLQMTAALLGLHFDVLESIQNDDKERPLDITNPAEKHAIHKVLVSKLLNLQKSLQDSEVELQYLRQQGNSNPMLPCLAAYLQGQMSIIDINLQTLAAPSANDHS